MIVLYFLQMYTLHFTLVILIRSLKRSQKHSFHVETTGIAFSPKGMHMYFAYQGSGLLFEVKRVDGLSFFNHAASTSDPLSPPSPSIVDVIEGGLSSLADWILPSSGVRKEDESF